MRCGCLYKIQAVDEKNIIKTESCSLRGPCLSLFFDRKSLHFLAAIVYVCVVLPEEKSVGHSFGLVHDTNTKQSLRKDNARA